MVPSRDKPLTPPRFVPERRTFAVGECRRPDTPKKQKTTCTNPDSTFGPISIYPFRPLLHGRANVQINLPRGSARARERLHPADVPWIMNLHLFTRAISLVWWDLMSCWDLAGKRGRFGLIMGRGCKGWPRHGHLGKARGATRGGLGCLGDHRTGDIGIAAVCGSLVMGCVE